MNLELFDNNEQNFPQHLSIGPGTIYLSEFLRQDETDVLCAIRSVTSVSPFRHLTTPGGKQMSVAMSNCGALGWVSDHAGYRYQAFDPLTNHPWPAMPAVLLTLAQKAALAAGYKNFQPNVCLINRYETGARMGLHQDRDERNLTAPIVSFSLGLPATFIWGGHQRTGSTQRFTLKHGDALVWGGEDRLRFHGVAPLKAGQHALTGAYRFNITFRQTGT
ncbi:MAG: DNA oxidative demethylase AlkB [Gammaproteobacteria bacterium]|nr:DNA oxidative demethylase AlkB [Gammaproteobacteria bacterium]